MAVLTKGVGKLPVHSLFDEFFRVADDFDAMQQKHRGELLAGNWKNLFSWRQNREQAVRRLGGILEKVVACGQDNADGVVRAREIMRKLLVEEDVLRELILDRQLKMQEQLLAMRKGKVALQGYNINQGQVPRPRYLSNKM